MQELPLFPLDTVLFPGAPLHLHIFEERYKRMINNCVNQDLPFGVVLIEHGVEAFGPLAQPHAIGTTAKIIRVQKLADQRLNIAIVGLDRFQIISLEPDLQPYLVGYVEPLIISSRDNHSLISSGEKLRRWVQRYLHTLTETGAGQFDISQFPKDPIELAYLSAAMLEMSNLEKQALLSKNLAEDLLSQVMIVYRREIALLRVIAAKQVESQGQFSLN